MAHFFFLSVHIKFALRLDFGFNRNPLHHVDSVAFQPVNFVRIVCHDPQLCSSQVFQDLRAYREWMKSALQNLLFSGADDVKYMRSVV